MKLSQWAKKVGKSYRRAWQLFKEGKIPNAYRLPTGTIIVEEQEQRDKVGQKEKVSAIYCRVSSAENKENLEKQAKRLQDYAIAKGYRIQHIVKEVGSGVSQLLPLKEVGACSIP